MVPSCELFSFEQTTDAALHKWTFLSCETSFSPSFISFAFPSSSKNTSDISDWEICLTQSCTGLNINDSSKDTGFLLQVVMGPQGTQLVAAQFLLDWPAAIPPVCQLLYRVTAGKVMWSWQCPELFPPGFQTEVIFKSKCNEVATVFIEVASFYPFIDFFWSFLFRYCRYCRLIHIKITFIV